MTHLHNRKLYVVSDHPVVSEPPRPTEPKGHSYSRGRLKAPQLRIRNGQLTAHLRIIVTLPASFQRRMLMQVSEWLQDPSLTTEERKGLEHALRSLQEFR